ncbi:hypothetical protein EPA93_46045 [Ktedonosporobacter rubrisoli]|uniref:Uncharacterized protein n=1 Tax=Ktedonosporobacter rubrisoli TaxID=2509675 RepID=A0A4P6K3U3_KTERU|nr:hypothetical protein [Ktedonosporobacter rubrisoli]QBD82937.1 hypothetical protein EPA93_46045 [Ktedonosporobacter rubrisoli]
MVLPSDDNTKQNYLLATIRAHFERLVLLHQHAHAAYCLVDKEKDITSSQCTRFVAPLFPSEHPVVSLKNFLEHPLHFSPVDTHRQQLLIALDQINKHIQQLQLLSSNFSLMGFRTSLEESKNIRNSILETLQLLEEKLVHFNNYLKYILEKAEALLHHADSVAGLPASAQEEPISSTPSDPSSLISEIEQQKPLIQDPPALSYMTSISNASSQTSNEDAEKAKMQELYEKLSQYTTSLDLEEICLNLHVNQNRLDKTSHAAASLSLVLCLYNENRLDDLEKELRRKIPKRFPPTSSESTH